MIEYRDILNMSVESFDREVRREEALCKEQGGMCAMSGLFGADGFRMNKNKPRDYTRLTQHFFFFTKRKPVLKEKQKGCF